MIRDTVPPRMKRGAVGRLGMEPWMEQEAATQSLQHSGGDGIEDRS
jgi:hypothetical protein